MESATSQRPPDTTRSPHEIARNFRSFILIWVAQLVARIGNGLTAFGLGVYAYQLTGRSTAVALVTMAAFLPGVLLAPLGGVLADRFDRRLLMILGDALSAIGLLALLLLIQAGIGNVAIVCACVAFSSIFTSVMDPAYRATISDLLTPEQYARASGMVQFASASQYLISPALAGILMSWFGIGLVLLIDIGTMAVTTLCMVLVWRTIKSTKPVAERGFWADLRFGVAFLARNRGITVLMLLVTFVTFCMGFLQTLLTPMLLDLSNEEVLGVVRSVAAVGMVVASLAIGIFSMGHRHINYIAIALAGSGVVTLLMGATMNVLLIGAFCFIFFMMLPPLNTSVEVLVRASIPNETQGKVWGLMGLISQIGYIVAYAVSGVLADYVFNPLLVSGGALADSAGALIGVGESRGIGLMLIIVGVLLVGTAIVMTRVKSIRVLEENLKNQTLESTR
ncbi:putative MFS family arabinose efflux permease [Stackebrandtia endophytica]|uniref:Putative MFS family arabinose efflux permease n=1 Tax=Stackebrandtia endophytica TaxID=1496996 RepID=A0A543AVU2_9ACTN|nr:MFS transporter [Stackebrandtia endophytica]TQL76697.1 putative MFS family arabinose efflux permease [Stackebrandtia endophytica]